MGFCRKPPTEPALRYSGHHEFFIVENEKGTFIEYIIAQHAIFQEFIEYTCLCGGVIWQVSGQVKLDDQIRSVWVVVDWSELEGVPC